MYPQHLSPFCWFARGVSRCPPFPSCPLPTCWWGGSVFSGSAFLCFSRPVSLSLPGCCLFFAQGSQDHTFRHTAGLCTLHSPVRCARAAAHCLHCCCCCCPFARSVLPLLPPCGAPARSTDSSLRFVPPPAVRQIWPQICTNSAHVDPRLVHGAASTRHTPRALFRRSTVILGTWHIHMHRRRSPVSSEL